MVGAVRVRTDAGVVEGSERNGVATFLGVPYAAPPTGGGRWRPPSPVSPWTGVRSANEYGNASIQTVDPPWSLRAPQSEDSLYLNVWSPDIDACASLPVMVWIHGGGSLWGANSIDVYDATTLARRGVVIVSINYRLGALGFLADPELGANAAVHDWVAALRWVAANATAFGGDPGNVTVFGQSAGAVAARTLLSVPSAEELFQRVILQSAGFEPYAFADTPSLDRLTRASRRLLERLGGRQRAQRASAHDVRAASFTYSGTVPAPGHVHTPANLVWYPVADGDVVVADAESARPAEVPVLLGCVQNEARYFIKPGPSYTWEAVERMAGALAGPLREDALDLLHGNWSNPYDALDELFTTACWFEPELATLERFATHGRPSHSYRFTRTSPGLVHSNELAQHTAEIPYVLGSLSAAEAPDELDSVDAAIAESVQEAWTSFARTGTPAASSGDPWPRWDASEGRATLIGDTVRAIGLR